MDRDLPLRITLEQPPPDVDFRVQRGRNELLPPVAESGAAISFDLALGIRSAADGALDFRGPLVQGRPGGRFVYVNSGTSAGQAGSCWTRRAKVPLAGITREMVSGVLARPGAVLEARIPGTARDGGPVCASVRVDGGWRIVPR